MLQRKKNENTTEYLRAIFETISIPLILYIKEIQTKLNQQKIINSEFLLMKLFYLASLMGAAEMHASTMLDYFFNLICITNIAPGWLRKKSPEPERSRTLFRGFNPLL